MGDPSSIWCDPSRPEDTEVSFSVLARVQTQFRYRRALHSMAAPRKHDPAYFSRFGGLWTDRHDAGEEIERRVEASMVTESDAERLRHWVDHGFVILEQGVEPEMCDRLRADLDRAFQQGDERLLMTTPAHGQEGYRPLTPDVDKEGARVADVYVYYESARETLFSDAIVQFLRTVFDDAPLLFQSLTFEKGSGQSMHQDTAFVVTMSAAGVRGLVDRARGHPSWLGRADVSRRQPPFAGVPVQREVQDTGTKSVMATSSWLNGKT